MHADNRRLCKNRQKSAKNLKKSQNREPSTRNKGSISLKPSIQNQINHFWPLFGEQFRKKYIEPLKILKFSKKFWVSRIVLS